MRQAKPLEFIKKTQPPSHNKNPKKKTITKGAHCCPNRGSTQKQPTAPLRSPIVWPPIHQSSGPPRATIETTHNPWQYHKPPKTFGVFCLTKKPPKEQLPQTPTHDPSTSPNTQLPAKPRPPIRTPKPRT